VQTVPDAPESTAEPLALDADITAEEAESPVDEEPAGQELPALDFVALADAVVPEAVESATNGPGRSFACSATALPPPS